MAARYPYVTPEGKWLLWDVATGQQLERWSVDAKILLHNGTHVSEPPAGVEPQLPPGPPAAVQPPRVASAQTFVAPADAEAPSRPKKKE